MLKNIIIKLLLMCRLYNTIKTFKDRFLMITPSYRQHKIEMKEFYSQFINSGDLCFDIGANIGNRTEIFLSLNARVVAVEPQSECLKKLRKTFGENTKLTIIPKALGQQEGEGTLLQGTVNTISTMSKDWISKMKESGRFSGHDWHKFIKVPVTTLDSLIRIYGTPKMCKIDVEGFEPIVLKGLSQPVTYISFEFNSEVLENAIECIYLCSKLGEAVYNYSNGESMKLSLDRWVDKDAIIKILQSFDKGSFGDVYAWYIK